MYKLVYTEEAKKRIARLDEPLKAKILEAAQQIAKDPAIGKPLTRELKGRFSYRIGDYRIIYKVYRTEIVVLILTVGHRRDVYSKARRKTI